MWKFLKILHKKKLDEISPTFCLAKWTQSSIHLESGTTHSCHHCPVHHIPLEEIQADPAALHNTVHKIKQRELMLEGQRPSECDYCWRVEDAGKISDRVVKSFTDWTRPSFSKIIKEGASLNIPKFVEISFDNTCNLKCSYCGPHYSNSWINEINAQGSWPKEIDHYKQDNSLKDEDKNPYIEAFWKWFPDTSKTLHTFRITGGEPLLSKNVYKVLDYLIENPRQQLNLEINSNLCVQDKTIDSFIEKVKTIKVKSITIHASCDTSGEAAEYARHGLDYQKWLSNCYRILNEIPKVKLDIMVTYNIFSVTTFTDFLKDISELKAKSRFKKQVIMSINYLRSPDHLAVWTLPETYKKYAIEQLNYMKGNKFESIEINDIERIIPLFELYAEKKTDLQKKFKKFVIEHDRRRNTSFTLSVPTLKNFIDNIEL